MALATTEDVAARLMRDLTAAEEAAAEYAIDQTTGLIAEALDKDTATVLALSPVPETLKALCVEKAVQLIVNPLNVASRSETLGAFSHSETFPKASDVGLFLSLAERRRVRRAVFGTGLLSLPTPVPIEEWLTES